MALGQAPLGFWWATRAGLAGLIWLILRARTFDVILGLTLLSYAVNVLIFSMGRLRVAAAPIVDKAVENLSLTQYTDPLPQALVLTAIVIAFGMTAFVVILSLRSFLETGSDHVDGDNVPCDAQDGMAESRADTAEGGQP